MALKRGQGVTSVLPGSPRTFNARKAMPRRKRTRAQSILVSPRSRSFVLPPATQADIEAGLAEWKRTGKTATILRPIASAALPLYTARCRSSNNQAADYDDYAMEF